MLVAGSAVFGAADPAAAARRIRAAAERAASQRRRREHFQRRDGAPCAGRSSWPPAGSARTSPNPVVGCVVLDCRTAASPGRAGTRTPAGRTPRSWRCAAAGERARGGTAVVTLEPCSHTGRTGACTTALLDGRHQPGRLRGRRPESGRRPAAPSVLRAAGVEVEGGLLAAEAARGNEAWLHAVRRGRPFVIWKYGASLDGQIAAADGTSRWITGEQRPPRRAPAAGRGRRDRWSASAPCWPTTRSSPSARPPEPPPERQPLRVVFDRSGRTPAGAEMCDDSAETLITRRAPGEALGAPARARRRQRAARRRPDPGRRLLGRRPHRQGRRLRLARPARQRPLPGAALGARSTTIAAAPRLVLDDVTRFGEDVRLTSYPKGA